MVYLNDERVFRFAPAVFLLGAVIVLYFVTPFAYYRIELHELLSIEMDAHTTGTHCIQHFEFIDTYIRTSTYLFYFSMGTFGEILAKPERLNRDDNVTENPNA